MADEPTRAYDQPIPQQRGYGPATVQPGGHWHDTPPQESEPVRRRRRAWPIVLAVVLVTLVVLGVAGYLLGRPYLAEYPATLTLPDTLAGHERSTNPELRQAADRAVTELRREIDLQDAVADFYQDPADDTRIVWLIGGTKLILNPASEIDAAFRGVGAGADLTMSAPTEVDPGPLGGVARCSSATISDTDDLPIAVCAWADHGALAIVMFFNRAIEESADLLRQIRAQVQSR
jgi:hypothetical protein